MKNKLLISGRISDREVTVLNNEFKNDEFDIIKYTGNGAVISGVHDIVSLIFDDLSPLTFTRDYLIGKIIDIAYSKVKTIASRLREKDKVVNELIILREYHKRDGSLVFIRFHAKEQKVDILINEVCRNLSFDFLEGVHAGENVYVGLDENDRLKLEIF